MAIIINKQIYANGRTYMASFLGKSREIRTAQPAKIKTKWHRSRKLFSNNDTLFYLCVPYQFYWPNPVDWFPYPFSILTLDVRDHGGCGGWSFYWQKGRKIVILLPRSIWNSGIQKATILLHFSVFPRWSSICKTYTRRVLEFSFNYDYTETLHSSYWC